MSERQVILEMAEFPDLEHDRTIGTLPWQHIVVFKKEGPEMIRVTTVPKLPPRAADSHKGTFGRVLVVAGSKGMSGAAVLCGTAALRGGAGLVTVACPPDVVHTVAAGNPCYMTAAIPQTSAGKYETRAAEELIRLAEDADALAIGPGLGARPDVAELLRTVLSALPTVRSSSTRTP